MAIRPIDGEELLGIERLLDTDVVRKNETASWLLDQVLHDIQAMPTLTPPNEWLTLDSRLTPKMVTCPKGWQGVRDTRFYCPGCKKAVKKGEAYCHKCGQALIFPVQRYDKKNNRIWLDFSDRCPPEGEEDT